MSRTPMLDALKRSWLSHPPPTDPDALMHRIGTLHECEDEAVALVLEEILVRAATTAFDELGHNSQVVKFPKDLN
jgi:hypothetical protein